MSMNDNDMENLPDKTTEALDTQTPETELLENTENATPPQAENEQPEPTPPETAAEETPEENAPTEQQPDRITTPEPQTPATELAQDPPAESPAPEPPPADEPDTAEQKRRYWRGVLTGDPATVPTAVRGQSGVDEWEASDEQKEYRLLSTVNKSWAADHLPHTREKIHAEWGKQRAELTRKLGVQDNERELFIALSQEEEDAPRREAAGKIFEESYMAGLDGHAAANPEAHVQGLSAADARNAEQLARAAYAQGKKKRESLLTLAERISNGIDAFAAVEEDAVAAPRVMAAMPDLISAVDALAELSDEDANTALYLAAGITRERNPQGDTPGLAGRAIMAINRGTVRTSMGILQALSNTGISALNRLGDQVGSRALNNAARDWDKRMQMLNKLRKLSQDELRPLVLPEEKNGAASYLITAAEAAPTALLSCCGGAGFAALTLGAVGDSVAEARNRAPMASQELQLYAGLLAGAIQAGIYMNLNRVGGRLLEQSISRIGRASGQGISGYTLAGLNILGSSTAEAAKMLAAGKLAAATDMGAQELAARLSHTASNIDWQDFGDNLTDIETNMHEAAALLPFLLLGSGRLALEHFRSPRAILGDGEMMNEWGIPEQQQNSILNEQNLLVQSRLLHEAVAGSKLWSGVGFLPAAWRALRLLHSDSFHEFKEIEHIHDFLQLPAESRTRPTPQPSDAKPPYDPQTAGSNRNRAVAMSLLNEWWSRSGIDRSPEPYPDENIYSNTRSTPTERSTETYIALSRMYQSQVPPRMREQGIYAPYAERERRIMMRDRVSDLKELSYQFLMNIYSVDTLASDARSLEGVRSKTERTRTSLLGAVARAVVSTAHGVPREEALEGLDKYVSDFYTRRKYKGIRPDWIKQVSFVTLSTIPQMVDSHPAFEYNKNPELLDAFRLAAGLRADTGALIDLLPHMTDFQTALTRGLSPAEAYSLILSRELELPKNTLKSGSIKAPAEYKNDTPMPLYTKQNSDRFEIYRQLTGYEVERSLGDDAIVYTRARRPDGSYTHWHEKEDFAVNDVAGNASLFFLPFGHNLDMQRMLDINGDSFDLRRRPVAAHGVFSTYDQLCSLARRDLNKLWMSNATRVQPGMFSEQPRDRFYKSEQNNDLTPRIREIGARGEDFDVDIFSNATPLSLAHSRFYIYWQRMLNSHFFTPEQLGDYLVTQGHMTPEEKTAILTPRQPSPAKKIQSVRQTVEDAATIGIMHGIANAMAQFTTLRFLAQLPGLPMPRSVKEWYAMAAFCPEPENANKYASRIAVKSDGTGIISWANRLVSQKLRSMAPQVEAMRASMAKEDKSPTIFDSLMQDAMGLDTQLNSERGWCYHSGGAPAVQGASQSFWNLLRHPRTAWENMPETERAGIRRHVEEFCRRDPIFSQSGEGDRDVVTHAFHVLDDLLKEYPQMHRYSITEGSDTRVRLLNFKDEAYDISDTEEPLYKPHSLYGDIEMTPGCDVYATTKLPDFITYDSRARSGLALLDTLRRYPARLPHAYRDSIWWQGERYGLGAKSPTGLDKNYYAERPLEPLVQLLREVHDYSAAHGSLSICGVELQGIRDDLNLSPLSAITIYRSKKDRSHIYRLMPGDPSLENTPLRMPYLVHCRNGVYLNNRMVIRDAAGMDAAYLPLHTFYPQPMRRYSKDSEAWANAAWSYNVDKALHHSLRANLNNPGHGDSAYMLEYLMRLTEDSGLSPSLAEVDPTTLTMGQAHLLNLARDMLLCLCSAEPHAAQKRLIRQAKRYTSASQITPLVAALRRANEGIPGKNAGFFPILEDELQKAFDAEEDAYEAASPDQQP